MAEKSRFHVYAGQLYDVIQSTETTFAGLYRCEELATQLISHHASIFLCVIILGMNGNDGNVILGMTMEMSVDQFEEAGKKRNKNENTAMSEQAKVGGKLKLRLSGIKPAKDRVESPPILSNPTYFSPTYQRKSFRICRICHK